MPVINTPLDKQVAFSSTNLLQPTDYYIRADVLPDTNYSNISISTDTEFGTNSLLVANGYIDISNVDTGLQWQLSGWYKFTPGNSTILSINGDSPLTIGYDTASSYFYLKYSVNSNNVVYRELGQISLTDWSFIQINRDGNSLRITINLTINITVADVFIRQGMAAVSIGKDLFGTNHLKAYIQSTLFSFDVKYQMQSNSLEQYRYYFTQSATCYDINLLYNLDQHGNQYFYPNHSAFSYFDTVSELWKIAPTAEGISPAVNLRGLQISTVERKYYRCLVKGNYRFDIEFRLDNLSNDVLIASTYNSLDGTGFYIVFRKTTQTVVLYYQNTGTALQAVSLGSYSNGWKRITLSSIEHIADIYVDSVLLTSAAIRVPVLAKILFNHNLYGVINPSSVLTLKSLDVHKTSSANTAADLMPKQDYRNNRQYRPSSHVVSYNYHQIPISSQPSPVIEVFTTDDVSYSITSPTTSTGQSQVLVTIQQPTRTYASVYKLNIRIPRYSNMPESLWVIPEEVVVNAGDTTVSVPIQLKYIDGFINSRGVKLEIKTRNYHRQIPIYISDVPLADVTEFQINGYIEAVFNLNSLEGTVVTGNTTHTSIYGDIIELDSTSVSLNPSITNVRTAVLVYQETTPTNNRVYLGGSSYTFNGGVNGELVGDLITSGSDYLNVRQDSGVYSSVAVSKLPTNPVVVRVNDAANTVEVLKQVNNEWTGTWQALSLGLQSPSSVSSASLDITADGSYCVIGFPSANNGEGVVQVWNLQTLTKELHLGSPLAGSVTGGFGKQVAIDNDGLTIVASDPLNNCVRYYRKLANWSALPLYTVAISEPVTKLSIRGTQLLISAGNTNAAYVARFNESSNAITLVDTYPGEAQGIFDKLTSRFVTADIAGYSVTVADTGNSSVSNITSSGPGTIDISNNLVAVSNWDTQQVKLLEPPYTSTLATVSSTYTDYGIYLSLGDTLVVSNYDNILDILTSSPASYGERVSKVYRNGTQVPNTDVLTTDNIEVLTFVTAAPMTIDKIGTGYNQIYGANHLNGIFKAALFYDRVLSGAEIVEISNKLQQYLDLRETQLAR